MNGLEHPQVSDVYNGIFHRHLNVDAAMRPEDTYDIRYWRD
jgi:hypothetical protein